MRLPERWIGPTYLLRPHAAGEAYSRSRHRFNTVPAGRRSGKTERAKRKLVVSCIEAWRPWPERYFAGAPTRDQAKRIFWDDLKALTPPEFLAGRPSETDLCITYINGSQLWVVGLDKPARIEGSPWDGGVLDEYGNMKPEAWGANIRPALSDRQGWCDFIGVPEGRNHYYELDASARGQMQSLGEKSEWGSFTWPSADVLPASEIEAAKRDLDPLTFQQEYEASFVNFQGRAYYPFLEATHAKPLRYDPRAPLIFCFDFNVDPGVAAVLQEQPMPGQYEIAENGGVLLGRDGKPIPIVGTGVIGEVWIPRNSNTPAVCRKLVADWGQHQGRVTCYGDASGGARGTAKVQGSDWELIEKELRPVFRDRLLFKVKASNPAERARVNAVNSRLKTMAGTIRLMVDPLKAPHVVKDFEGVKLLEGGGGEIEKVQGSPLTHLTDGIGYYVESEFPVQGPGMARVQIGGA